MTLPDTAAPVAVGPPAADPTGNGQASTQRERLRRRRLPTVPVAFPRDREAYDAAARALATALVDARRNPAAATAALTARAALDEAAADPEIFVVTAIPAPEWEALKALHPPTTEQTADGQTVNLDTWRPEVLAACVAPPPGEPAYTAAEWVEFATDGRVSAGEQDILVNTALLLNERAVQLDPGKGWTATRS